MLNHRAPPPKPTQDQNGYHAMVSLKGKVALVTGSSSGIGEAIAVELAARGCRLLLTGRDTARLGDTRHKCLQAGAAEKDVWVCQADLFKDEEITNLAESSVRHFERVDILVNNAATVHERDAPIQTSSVEALDATYKINFRAPYLLTQKLLPTLIKHQGTVINIASALGHKPIKYISQHASMKAALIHLTKCLAMELGPLGVRVNSVSPGVIEGTRMYPRTPGDRSAIKLRAQWTVCNQLGPVRPGLPQDVARAVAYLASPDAAFITGTDLPVDGGFCIAGTDQIDLSKFTIS